MLHRLKNLGEAQGPDQTCHQRALYRKLQERKEDPLESYVPPRSQETASKTLESYYGQDRLELYYSRIVPVGAGSAGVGQIVDVLQIVLENNSKAKHCKHI